jgi:hypothetical protein
VRAAPAPQKVVILRESGGSSTLRPFGSITDVSGILGRPVKPGDDSRVSNFKQPPPSLRANGSRECAPDDKLREAIQLLRSKEESWIASSLSAFAR